MRRLPSPSPLLLGAGAAGLAVTATGIAVATADISMIFELALAGAVTLGFSAYIQSAVTRILTETRQARNDAEKASEFSEASMHLQLSRMQSQDPQGDPRPPGPRGPVRGRRWIYEDGIPTIAGVESGYRLDPLGMRAALRNGRDAS